LTGDATNADPVCTLTPWRAMIDTALQEATGPLVYRYRYISREPEQV